MAKSYEEMSEEELVELIDNGIESQEQLAEILVAMQSKGMSGGFIGFSGDDPAEYEVTMEYVNYHDKISETSTKKEIDESLKALKNPKTGVGDLKKAIIILAHTGELAPLKALEKFAKTAKDDLKIWIKIAIDECKMFLESKLLDRPRIKITKIEND